jgi:hypothetical protein
MRPHFFLGNQTHCPKNQEKSGASRAEPGRVGIQWEKNWENSGAFYGKSVGIEWEYIPTGGPFGRKKA